MKEAALDFYEIYGYYYQPIWQKPYFNFIMISLVFLLFVLGLYLIIRYWLKKRRKKLLPWVWAYSQMDLLHVKDVALKSDYKKFYFDLILIIKKYLKIRFNWQTEDKTDEELLQFLKEKSFDPALLAQLRVLLQEALMVRFADQNVLRVQAKRDFKSAFLFIESTIPVEKKLN